MGLYGANFHGIKISYFPTITGNLDHISIRFRYNDDTDIYNKYYHDYDPNLLHLAPLFTEDSLIKTRDFLYKHSVKSIKINLPEKFFGDEKLPIHLNELYETLGIRFGELIKSIPSITTVYVEGVTQFSYFPLLKIFENHLCERLGTSLAKPKLFKQVEEGSFDNALPKVLKYSVEYADRRTFSQKWYHFAANIPLVGVLIRAVSYLFYGDSEKKHFTNSSRKIDDVINHLRCNQSTLLAEEPQKALSSKPGAVMNLQSRVNRAGMFGSSSKVEKRNNENEELAQEKTFSQ